jgi:hypothetical protein
MLEIEFGICSDTFGRWSTSFHLLHFIQNMSTNQQLLIHHPLISETIQSFGHFSKVVLVQLMEVISILLVHLLCEQHVTTEKASYHRIAYFVVYSSCFLHLH